MRVPKVTRVQKYCEYSAAPSKCKAWLREFHPTTYEQLYAAEIIAEQLTASSIQEGTTGAGEKNDELKKHQTRGGKALSKDLTKQKDKEELKKKVTNILYSWLEVPETLILSSRLIIESSGDN